MMNKPFRTVYTGGTGEITEKKSRFIANVAPVLTEDDALEFIEQLKKKYWDARHNCYAYVIGPKDEIQRCSDDGEPSKTAGRPILDVLLGEEIHNTVIVVTRYFGGTLLGTGGLVRAYQSAAKEGLSCSTIVEKLKGQRITVTTDYNGIGKIQYLISQLGITILDTEYTDIVKILILIPDDIYTEFIKKTTEATNGKAQVTEDGEVYFATISGQVEIF
ncbi:YigZ family protein [Anaerocolumna sedimenticola]|uniref:YigZ family protein n=2 Tax=Anaerocolumna sedimenticola TaxID=2696063 RepID=A0A6P1TEE2_9FIRM|nr:YigZ family protein [Anaerocolumna sedimenticola]QHQ59534.1 YigZ family protein [Anaerocolumna sedimenticola]